MPLVHLSWPAAILLLGLFSALMLAALLLRWRSNARVANQLLAGWLLLMAYQVAIAMLRFSEPARQHGTGEVYPGFYFLNGPLYYFIIRASLERQFRFIRRDLLHLIPTVGVVLARLVFTGPGLQPPVQQRVLYHLLAEPWKFIIFVIFSSAIIAYLVLGFQRIARYTTEVKATRSFADWPHVRWLMLLSLLMLIPLASTCFLALQKGILPAHPGWNLWPAYAICLSVALLAATILVRPAVLSGLPAAMQVEEATLNAPEPARRYGYSTLTAEQKTLLYQRLQAYITAQSPWKNQELTLDDLSAGIGSNSRAVSQIINEIAGKNFFDLVNGYRIGEAKKMLVAAEFQHYTIQAIAEECGFKSRSAFYTAFRQITGQTPTQYKSQAASGA